MKTIEESTLRNLIRKSILEILKAKEKGILLEMPFPRKAYKEKIDNEIPQILTNWCLVHFCSITKRTQTKEHWIGELRGHLITASCF